MRHSICILFLAIIAFSCEDHEEDPLSEFPQTWNIIGWQDFGIDGDSGFKAIRDSTHSYVFKVDGTFTKTVGSETASGRYKTEIVVYEVVGEQRYYSLIFPDEKLIHSCSKVKEYLFVDEGMLIGGDAPCGGTSTYFSLETK